MARQVNSKKIVRDKTKTTLTLDTIGSVMIYVNDFNRAFDFYTKTLGFKAFYKEKGFCTLDTKPVCLFLHWGKKATKVSSDTVVAFAVKDVKDTWKKLKDIGVKNLTDLRSPCRDILIAKFEDTEGNILQIEGHGTN